MANRTKKRAAKPSESSRERIHSAALRLFARYGFAGVGMQRIADEVGLHKSSLFHHYKNKLELATEVFDVTLRRVIDHLEPLASEDVPKLETLYTVADVLVDHFSDHPDDARLVVQAMSAPLMSEVRVGLVADADSPTVELLTIFWSWLEKAKKANVARAFNLRQGLFNLIGLMCFYPAVADFESFLAGPEPFSDSARSHRKVELRAMIRGMLEPTL